MNKHKCLLLLSLLTGGLLIPGCSDDHSSLTNTNEKTIILSGEIDQLAVTRVNDGGFGNGDAIGVYIVDYQGATPGKLTETGNRANNVKFTFDEAAYRWNGAYDIYWKDDKTNIDVYGYYPYSTPESIETYAFEIQKDQAREAAEGRMGGYEASDFLWAKSSEVAPTTSIVRLAFKHRMSNIKVSLVEGTGFATAEWADLNKQMLVLNTKRNALIDLSSGTVTTTGQVANTGIIPAKDREAFRAIVVPQTLPASTTLFSITVGNVAYKFIKEESFTYVGGKMHNFSIVVNKKANTGDYEFVLASESITPWENDLVSHDATAREYIIIDVPEAGTLATCIAAAKKDYKTLQNLKITGRINEYDFDFMRNNMDKLQSLNLKEVVIDAVNHHKADWIPNNAMSQKRSLVRLVLPDKLKGIGWAAFYWCEGLTGSLIIPEGVIEVDDYAFQHCKNMTGILSLPTTLERIGNFTFEETGFTCELLFPSKLKYIGDLAFHFCTKLYGSFNLPDNLTYLGELAFYCCSKLTGSICIPQGITEIRRFTFGEMTSIDGALILHNNITSIGSGAFQSIKFRGELTLPKGITIIGANAFQACSFSGELKLPDDLVAVGDMAFEGNYNLTGTLEIPKNVQNIGTLAFGNCTGIERLILPAELENLNDHAFYCCTSLNSIVCNVIIPPSIQPSVFDGVSKDNFTLEVPMQAVQQYQIAPGWSEFKRISAHRELLCRPASATVLNKQSTRKLVLEAEGNWEVESMPDWCSLSTTSGTQKAELTLTIHALPRGSATRDDKIVFKLKDKDYTAAYTVTQYDYEYDEDQVLTLQQASKGKGINLVFIGDGFSANDISNGEYLSAIRQQIEYFFGVEPYTTYRNYFNVYAAITLSPESGVGTVNTVRKTRFGTSFTGNAKLSCDTEEVFGYALNVPTVTTANLHQSLIILTPNTTEYEGTCYMWADGSAIAICPLSAYTYPYDTRGVLQHEAGGHGFGKLGDEYIYHNEFIDHCPCGACVNLRSSKALGWFQNLSLTGKTHEVPWSHLIYHERYSNIVDIFEGGFMHTRGVFRSEQNSCMNNNVPYFSTISRESIVKRIMEYAGETYTFEKFLTNDKMVVGTTTTRSTNASHRYNPYGRQSGPYIYQGKPTISNKSK